MKTKFREPPKYDLQGSIEVFMNDRRYYAWLDTELVVGQVFGRNGKAFLRRVSSWSIETAVLLTASDIAHENVDAKRKAS